jgi:hypothetical protein
LLVLAAAEAAAAAALLLWSLLPLLLSAAAAAMVDTLEGAIAAANATAAAATAAAAASVAAAAIATSAVQIPPGFAGGDVAVAAGASLPGLLLVVATRCSCRCCLERHPGQVLRRRSRDSRWPRMLPKPTTESYTFGFAAAFAACQAAAACQCMAWRAGKTASEDNP